MNGACPLCRTPVRAPSLDDVIASSRLDGFEAAILSAAWASKGRKISTERIFDEMYADDPDGGPDPSAMYRAFRAALGKLNSKLAGSGIAVNGVGYRQGFRLSLGSQALPEPEPELTVEMVVESLTARQQCILGVIWNGKGRLVEHEAIIAVMDHFDAKAHSVQSLGSAISYLRKRLKPVGITIKNVHARGYRLVLGANSNG